jgi:hypothetical protein
LGLPNGKWAVADARQLFQLTANRTEQAFTANLKLRLLVAEGRLPGQLERSFELLIVSGVKNRIQPRTMCTGVQGNYTL